MTPEQLRRLADKWDESRPAEHGAQDPGTYMVNRTAHAMARFLRELADDEDAEQDRLDASIRG